MPKKLIIPGVSFSGPRRFDHPLLSAGSLALFDPTHTLGAFDGMPADGASIPNVARSIAADILGVEAALTDWVFRNASQYDNPSASIKERTAKGGLYGLFSHEGDNTLSGTSWLGIEAPDAIQEHIYNNEDHTYFVGGWMNVVRAGRAGSSSTAPQPFAFIVNPVSSTTNALYIANGSTSSRANIVGQRTPGVSSLNAGIVQKFVYDAAFTGAWSGTKPSLASMQGPNFLVGDFGAWNASNQPGLSGVIELAMVEDLTISGRSYAEVDALLMSLYASAHAEGGAWHGDSFTSPASLP